MSDLLKQQADLALAHAGSRLKVVRRQYDRAVELAGTQTLAQAELDDAQLVLLDAEYAVALAALHAQEMGRQSESAPPEDGRLKLASATVTYDPQTCGWGIRPN